MARDLDNDDVKCKDDERDVVSWVELTSRTFRVKGQKSVFVILAREIHPGAEAVRKIESQPFVQTVVRGKSSQQARVTVKEGSDGRNDTEALEEIDGLKFRLQNGKDRMQKVLPWKRHTRRWTCSGKSGRMRSDFLRLTFFSLRTTLVKAQSRMLQQQRSKSRGLEDLRNGLYAAYSNLLKDSPK